MCDPRLRLTQYNYYNKDRYDIWFCEKDRIFIIEEHPRREFTISKGRIVSRRPYMKRKISWLTRMMIGLVLMKNKDPASTKIFLDLASKTKDPEKRTAYTDLAYASILRTAGAQTADIECVLGKAETGAGGGATGPEEVQAGGGMARK